MRLEIGTTARVSGSPPCPSGVPFPKKKKKMLLWHFGKQWCALLVQNTAVNANDQSVVRNGLICPVFLSSWW